MNGTYPRRKGSLMLLLILYLIFGAYFINYALNFFLIPATVAAAIAPYNKWIIFVGGILIIIGAINHFRLSRYTSRYY